MTAARSSKIDLHITPYYHCMTRCVRRAFLCGKDSATGREYHHRKKWILNRLEELTNIFSIKICAYAVMNNHYHLVLFIDEKKALQWSTSEIKNRWARIFPYDAHRFETLTLSSEMAQKKINCWRERLMSISWFMRCLNEFIARLSNKEDDCTGRFWEGRFKSQALLDEAAVLSTMAYVDLNPIRAKIADSPETSEFTSIYERIQHFNSTVQPSSLMPFYDENNVQKDGFIDCTLSNYLELVDDTGRMIREDKPGAIASHLLPILTRLNLRTEKWVEMVGNIEKQFFHAIGETLVLISFGKHRKCMPRGMKAAKEYYC